MLLARVTGLEPATSGVTGRRSNQLSYTRNRAPRLRPAPGRVKHAQTKAPSPSKEPSPAGGRGQGEGGASDPKPKHLALLREQIQNSRMPLSITGLTELRTRLERLRAEDVMSAALAQQAEHMAQSVRDSLSNPQGAGDHDKPWLRTGALRDSIEATTNGLEAAIGSNDPAAAPQELGTSRIPPRPFLAPVAAASGEEVARAIGDRVAQALTGAEAAATG